MAQKSTWSDVDLSDPLMQRLAAAGKQGVLSGQVPLEDAQAHAEAMGLLPKGTKLPPAPSLSMANEPDPSNVLDVNAAPLPGQPSVAAMGASSPEAAKVVSTTPQSVAVLPGAMKGANYKRQVKNTANNTEKDTANNYMDPEKVAAAMEVIRQSPEYQNVQQGDERMQSLLSMAAQQKSADPGWIKPLLALADSQTGSKLMEGYTPGPTQQQITSELLKYQDELQKRKADNMKAILQGVTAQKGGGSTVNVNTHGTSDMGQSGVTTPTFDRQQQQQDRLDFMAHQRTLSAIRSDKNLRDKLVQYQNLGNAMSNLVNADHMTPQQFDEAQQAIRANLGIKGSSGVGERERTQLNALGISADRIQQILSGKPTDIDNPEFVDHIKDLAGLETNNIKQQYSGRLNAVAGGNASMYDRRPDLQGDLQGMIGANQAQLVQPAAPAGHVKTAPRNQAQKAVGATPALPTLDDLDAELARRKGGK